MPQTAMLQSILHTHAREPPSHDSEARTHAKQKHDREKRVTENTTLRVKMKVVRKSKNLKPRNGEIQADNVAKPLRNPDKRIALLQIPSDERLRRRLSDSLELDKPAPRARRRSVSFDPLTVFKTAILENDLEAARSVLITGKVGANTTLDGVQPVILAAKDGCTECLELLIEQGAKIDVCDKRGCTPLELAVQGGHFDCAQLLIVAGANANSIRDGYFDESIENGRNMTGRSRSRTF